MSEDQSVNPGSGNQRLAVDEESMADQLLRRVQTLEQDKRWWQRIAAGSGCLLLFVLLSGALLIVGGGMYYRAAINRQEARIDVLELHGAIAKVWVPTKDCFPGTEVDKSFFELRNYPKSLAPKALTENDDPAGRMAHMVFAGYPVTKGHYMVLPE